MLPPSRLGLCVLAAILLLAPGVGCGGKPRDAGAPPSPPEVVEAPPPLPEPPTTPPQVEPPIGPSSPGTSFPKGTLFPERRLADGSLCYEVEVFYATDRLPENPSVFAPRRFLWELAWPLVGLSLAAAFLTGALLGGPRRLLAGLAVTATVFGLLAAHAAGLSLQQLRRAELAESRVYGVERNELFGRGRLELGRCLVTVPHDHRVGKLESPNLLWGEIREDAGRHIVLVETRLIPEESFYPALRGAVAADPRKQALVFIHGYNVPFKEAARRTGQMAYDLKFEGAAMFYSWPSQAAYAGYFKDEQNIEWTVPQLKRFLRRVVEESGAESIHLIAHSMGNRALAQVLKEFALETRPDAEGRPRKLFNQVVLAAPDIDAGTFVNTIVPGLRATAQNVTLYTSSGDRALQASRLAHGFRRVGDSSQGPLVVDGVETVDVSTVDTSLIGHAYYGGNEFLIDDLRALLHQHVPCAERQWLRELPYTTGRYWVFRHDLRAAGLPAPEPR